MQFIFLGDVHGNLNHCHDLADKNPNSIIVQVGDFGAGLIPYNYLLLLPTSFRFFPGNHDCRRIANELPHCLGDYGEAYERFFFVSGADSIDKNRRTEGVNWWRDEELTYQQAQDCLDKWTQSKVDILVSHDCPQLIAEGYKLIYDRTLTRNLLNAMIEARKPKMVIFGHHHRPMRLVHDDVQYIGLGIDEEFVVDI